MELKKLEELSDSLESILSELTAALGTSQAAEIRELLNSRRWGTADQIRLFLDVLYNCPTLTMDQETKQVVEPSKPESAAISAPKCFNLSNLLKKP